jgi:hypothetical protein
VTLTFTEATAVRRALTQQAAAARDDADTLATPPGGREATAEEAELVEHLRASAAELDAIVQREQKVRKMFARCHRQPSLANATNGMFLQLRAVKGSLTRQAATGCESLSCTSTSDSLTLSDLLFYGAAVALFRRCPVR